ncbi:Serine/threonine-protein kinase PknG [Corynebacterium ciconiae DSM 44920]|uniref:serine/threonine protein kinase n=1 Tax=Corynebacterium ciconiae TaxID=227319 RepID=UPI00036EAFD1|nr:serine/threonine protein kinase [Corynebacterium ciconiae]WKD62003.1 Serine/threonine-protein kinase PknG [Corynebacterium ciconiae DSM 44920]
MSEEEHPVMGTEAVPFDPFADEEDEEQELDSDSSIQALLADLGALRDGPNQPTAPTKVQDDPSERSRREALSTFRERRTHTRVGRVVAEGMVQLPFVPLHDPERALIDPSEDIAAGTEAPALSPGDVVANQYTVLGVIAHGGMGWVYLAEDSNVSGRWVVLKGMMADTSHPSQGVAEAEREFLADITHPAIVKIFNFIDDPRVDGGFIVMEFVGGPSLRDRAKRSGGTIDIDVAIGYILEVLPALSYLHSRGVVYNDLKPDNIIVTEDQVKLIDLGAVSGIGAFGYIYGTKGFQAPEVATQGPSVASDIYTIGRTLAALTLPLPMSDGVYEPGIPSPTAEPLLRRYLSFYRLLLRCTHEDPAQRFTDVSQLEIQLYGVLREILAIRDGIQYPSHHSAFSPQRTTFGTKHLVFQTDQLIDGVDRTVRITPDEVISALPVPLIDTNDPGASLLSGTSYSEPTETLETLHQAMQSSEYEHSTEIPLGVVRALLDLGFRDEAKSWLESLEDRLGGDWRHQWFSGVTTMLTGDLLAAQRHFNQVLHILPGEPAPKLALAAVNDMLLQESSHDHTALLSDTAFKAALLGPDAADVTPEQISSISDDWNYVTSVPAKLRFHTIQLYQLVWATNPTTVSSAFGLARQLYAEGQANLAVAALDKVPQASRHQRMAQLSTIMMLISGESNESAIRRAARRLEEIPTNEPRYLQLQAAVTAAGLYWLRSNDLAEACSPNELFDDPFTQTGLRYGLARCLRGLARSAHHTLHRYELIDMANKVRPTTWL